MGISSFVSPSGQIAHYGDNSGALNITLFNDWIDSVIASVEPTLTIQRLDSGTVCVQWPNAATAFTLQTSSDLGGTNWSAFQEPITCDGTNCSVVLTNTGPSRFWRLAKPASSTPSGLSIHGPPSMSLPSSKVAAAPLRDDLMPHVPVPDR